MYVNHTSQIDSYHGEKKWNELSVVNRQELINLKFGARPGDLESFMMSTGLKKAQYRGLIGLCEYAQMALEKSGVIHQDKPDSEDIFKIINYFAGTDFHAELLSLLNGKGKEHSIYDGAELENFSFVAGTQGDPLVACYDMTDLEARRYVCSLLQGKGTNRIKEEATAIPIKMSDEFSIERHPFLISTATNSGSFSRKLRLLFDCTEVKRVKQELELFFIDSNFLSKDFVLKVALRVASDADRTKYSISVDRMTPKQIALIILRNIAFQRLTTGQEHTYRGILGFMGQDYLKLFRQVLSFEVALGYTLPDEANSEIDELMQEIREIG